MTKAITVISFYAVNIIVSGISIVGDDIADKKAEIKSNGWYSFSSSHSEYQTSSSSILYVEVNAHILDIYDDLHYYIILKRIKGYETYMLYIFKLV